MPGGKIDIGIDFDTRAAGSSLGRQLQGIGNGQGSKLGKTLGLAVVGGLASVGVGKAISSTLKIGTEFQDQLNTLDAAATATDKQMNAVRATARALGNDLTLPATSAADAAEAMTELVKGGLSVDASMKAAKGTLQLAAAAQVDGATAATIQARALNAYSLKATDAAHVSDVLANVSNAATGEITDFAYGLAQAGAVAHQFDISLDDTAAALGVFANAGIAGSDAGTSLKSMLLALASPSAPAAKALRVLGVNAFDASGNFVGLSRVSDQLADAQKRLSKEQFLAATSTAFGSDASRAAAIFAQAGAKGFDDMAKAVRREGGAAEVAAAKTKGLGGAIQGFVSQIETVQIDVFSRAAPDLELLVRKASAALPKLSDLVLDNVDKAAAAAQSYGPEVAEAIMSRGSAILDAGLEIFEPLVEGAADLVEAALPYVLRFSASGTTAIRDLTEEVTPLAKAVGGALTSAAETAGGPVETLGTVLELTGDSAVLLVHAVGPLIDGLEVAVGWFERAPGPIQTTALAIGVAVLASGRLVKAFGFVVFATQTVALNLAALRLVAAAQFAGATRSAGAFAAALRGTVVGGLRGVVGMLGGPFGIAMIAGAGLLALFAARSQAAKKHQRELAEAGKAVAEAIGEQNGMINASVRTTAAKSLADAKLLDSAKKYGITSNELVDAVLTQGEAYDSVREKLNAFIATQELELSPGYAKAWSTEGHKAQAVGRDLEKLIGSKQAQLAADREIAASSASLTGPLKALSADFGVLADAESEATAKAGALKSALDQMAGGHLNEEEATKQLNDAVRGLGPTFDAAMKAALAENTTLQDTTGALNTTTEAGSALFTSLQGIVEAQAQAAQSAYDLAISQGKTLPAATDLARKAMDDSYRAFIKAATGAGLSETAARKLAERYGLLPDQVITLIKLEGTGTVGQQIGLVNAQIKGVPAGKTITLSGDVGQAVEEIQRAGGAARRTADGRYVITVDAKTQAAIQAALDVQRQINNMTATITVSAQGTGTAGGRRYAAIAQADGGIVQARAFAFGGFQELTPMRAGYATIVAPNTWRVIGDNVRVPEAYIPIERSARSAALLAETADRMGYALIRRYAEGGFFEGGSGGGGTVGQMPTINARLNVYLDGKLIDARIDSRFEAEGRELRLITGRPRS